LGGPAELADDHHHGVLEHAAVGQVGQETFTLEGHSDRVASVSFSPDGKRIVSGSNDNSVKVWDISSRDTAK